MIKYKIVKDKAVLSKDGVNFALTGNQIEEVIKILTSNEFCDKFYKEEDKD